jgi:hypothetical protein
MILGIDFSLKSTAATLKSGDTYTFYTFARTDVIKEDTSLALRAAGVIVNTLPPEPALPKKSTIAERERSSLDDACVLIPEITKWFCDLDIDAYGIEGFSFASTGNRLAQISGYQWVLRWELHKMGMTSDKFWIFSPMTVKATAGKGNFKKEEMIAAFINSEDPELQKTGLWKALKNQPSLFQTKRGAWVKPIDDLIDSWWVLKTTQAHRELQKHFCI